ncbi:O-acetylserine/cysteine efflux transporter [Arthrobacter woluwensis]|uniref:O-acetylserine/cysteine efflux transporter n=1 Tax=Arthrobacter woluwensis TaxID=156980 RepID=A0A1H4VM58_9MICC|nr:O-acetylserine/cysteine efflux transporter [Arthrobacter woluwensis]
MLKARPRHDEEVKTRHVLLALLVALIWGVNFVAIEAGLRDVPPLTFAALRFALVAFPLMLFVPRPRVPWWTVVGVGLFMSAGHLGFIYLAMHLGLPSGLAPLILQSQVLFTVLLAALLLGERPGRVQLLGIAAGVLGLGIVVLGRGASADVLPLLLGLAGGLSWGLGNVVSRSARGAKPFSLVVWSAAVVPVPLFALSMVLDGPAAPVRALATMGPVAWASTAFTVLVSTLLAFTVWNGLLQKYPAAQVAPFTLLVPPVAMLAGWLAFGEIPGVWDLVGGAVLLAGVAVSQSSGALLARRGRSAGDVVPTAAMAPATTPAVTTTAGAVASPGPDPVLASAPAGIAEVPPRGGDRTPEPAGQG